MTEGPGAGSTVRVAVCRVPSSAARMCSGPKPTLATQRILLFLPAIAGAVSGRCEAHTMAAMSPLSLRTYGTDGSGAEKPDLAHGGSSLDG